MKNKPNFTFRVIKNGKTIARCQTHSKRRFYSRIRSINWRNKPLHVYLRVSYGRCLSVRKKIESFYNDGVYDNKRDLLATLRAFTEEI